MRLPSYRRRVPRLTSLVDPAVVGARVRARSVGRRVVLADDDLARACARCRPRAESSHTADDTAVTRAGDGSLSRAPGRSVPASDALSVQTGRRERREEHNESGKSKVTHGTTSSIVDDGVTYRDEREGGVGTSRLCGPPGEAPNL